VWQARVHLMSFTMSPPLTQSAFARIRLMLIVWVCLSTISISAAQDVTTEDIATTQASGEANSSSAVNNVPPETLKKVEVLRQATFILVILVIVLAISLLAFRRWSRHFRNQVLRSPHQATVAEDVWAMHKTPEPDDDEIEIEENTSNKKGGGK